MTPSNYASQRRDDEVGLDHIPQNSDRCQTTVAFNSTKFNSPNKREAYFRADVTFSVKPFDNCRSHRAAVNVPSGSRPIEKPVAGDNRSEAAAHVLGFSPSLI